ncbi:MAG: S1 family peptidase [Myxococcales bacterium]|nr:S1 family peptidase [Myxococcales bacterium]
MILRRLCFTFVAISLVGCADIERLDLDPAATSRRNMPLVGGQTTTGWRAVGIVHSGGSSACTGTLIGKRAVLTAAHCVTSKTAPYPVLSQVRFYVDNFQGALYPASSVAVHPSWAGQGNQNDVAVVILNKDVSGVTPMPMASTKPVVGEAITLLGYGLTGAGQGQFGTKRIGTNTVNSVGNENLRFLSTSGAMVCNGDSGGPTFAKRGGADTLIGVHSTSAQGCATAGTDMRVDAYLPWIQAQLTKGIYSSPCSGGSQCVSGICLQLPNGNLCSQECSSKACPFGDTCVNTGNAQVPKVCSPGSGSGPKQLGDTCTDPLDCSSQICVPVPNKGSYCSEQCDPAQKNCPASFFCAPVQGGGGVCLPGGAKKLGETCTDSLDCETFICVAVPGKGNRCSQDCSTTQQNCPTGYTCAATTNGGGLCIEGSPSNPPPPLPPPPPPTVKKPRGDPCEKSEDCQTNLCANLSASTRICVDECDTTQPASCPKGYACVGVSGQATKGICLAQPPGKLGERCESKADCESNICASDGTASFCTELCDPSTGCPAGWSCVAAGSTQYACAKATQPSGDAGAGDAGTSGDGGGCALDPDTPASTPLVLCALALLALLGRRRRRR